HLEAVRVPLVVVDIPAGQRREIQVPDQDLFANGQTRKSISVQLHYRGIVDALEKIAAFRLQSFLPAPAYMTSMTVARLSGPVTHPSVQVPRARDTDAVEPRPVFPTTSGSHRD